MHTFTRTQTHSHAHTYAHAYTHTHTHTHTQTYTHARTHTYTMYSHKNTLTISVNLHVSETKLINVLHFSLLATVQSTCLGVRVIVKVCSFCRPIASIYLYKLMAECK